MLISERIRSIVAAKYEISPDSLMPETRFVDLGESLDFVEIILESEEVFRIKIESDTALRLENFGSLVFYIETIVNRIGTLPPPT